MAKTVKIAATPRPPYYAVIFTSTLRGDSETYEATAQRMIELAETQPGFLGIETARNALGISVSYWTDLASIQHWKTQAEHLQAQEAGKEHWYASFHVRIAKVEKAYGDKAY